MWQFINNAIRGSIVACVFFNAEEGKIKGATRYEGILVEVEFPINAQDPDGDLEKILDQTEAKINEIKDNERPIEGSGIVYE